jgi:hypothetical protein
MDAGTALGTVVGLIIIFSMFSSRSNKAEKPAPRETDSHSRVIIETLDGEGKVIRREIHEATSGAPDRVQGAPRSR